MKTIHASKPSDDYENIVFDAEYEALRCVVCDATRRITLPMTLRDLKRAGENFAKEHRHND